MVGCGCPLLINAVVEPWDLRARLQSHFEHHQYLKVHTTDEPYRDPRIEMYCLPVRLFVQLSVEGRLSRLNEVPVLCHGPVSWLEKGFQAGCMDYLKDSWTLLEFEIRALKAVGDRQMVYPWGVLRYDPFKIWYEDRSQCLTLYEYLILRMLLRFKGEIVRREQLRGIYDKSFRDSGHVVDLHISSLRKKIAFCLPPEQKGFEVILTIRRIGYLIR